MSNPFLPVPQMQSSSFGCIKDGSESCMYIFELKCVDLKKNVNSKWDKMDVFEICTHLVHRKKTIAMNNLPSWSKTTSIVLGQTMHSSRCIAYCCSTFAWCSFIGTAAIRDGTRRRGFQTQTPVCKRAEKSHIGRLWSIEDRVWASFSSQHLRVTTFYV